MLKESYIQFMDALKQEVCKELELKETDPLHIKVDVQVGIIDRSKEQELRAFMKKLEEIMTNIKTIAHSSRVTK